MQLHHLTLITMNGTNVVSALEKVSHIAIPNGTEENISVVEALIDQIDVEMENSTLETTQRMMAGCALLPTLAELMPSISAYMITMLVEELITVGH